MMNRMVFWVNGLATGVCACALLQTKDHLISALLLAFNLAVLAVMAFVSAKAAGGGRA